MQNRAVGYPECACAPYVNAYPPHSEMGALATMVLGGRPVRRAVQGAAYLALAIGVVGVARALGLGRPQALLGAVRRDPSGDRAAGLDGAERPRRSSFLAAVVLFPRPRARVARGDRDRSRSGRS
jgi:hypothetical protein